MDTDKTRYEAPVRQLGQSIESDRKPVYRPGVYQLVCAALIWALVFAAIGILLGCSTARAEEYKPALVEDMKCPGGFAALLRLIPPTLASNLAYFRCDFTTGTCERGSRFYAGSGTVFELLAPDRKTVIGHYSCDRQGDCYDYDQGINTNGNLKGRSIPQQLCDGGPR